MRKLLLLAALALMGGLTGCTDARFEPPKVQLRYSTPIERRASLSLLQRAWNERVRETSEEQCWYERRLIDRAAIFGRKIKNTETYQSACSFWMSCVREHIDRYDDDHYKIR